MKDAFQCSSASRKFLNTSPTPPQSLRSSCFSALQRAENSSIERRDDRNRRDRAFQCSSASRKFLNPHLTQLVAAAAEFQCSSASRKFLNFFENFVGLFAAEVSVLFSEPKIPQSEPTQSARRRRLRFSALQRAENSSIIVICNVSTAALNVSVLFSEPKIPQSCLWWSGRR